MIKIECGGRTISVLMGQKHFKGEQQLYQ